jgi:hypothetical protein
MEVIFLFGPRARSGAEWACEKNARPPLVLNFFLRLQPSRIFTPLHLFLLINMAVSGTPYQLDPDQVNMSVSLLSTYLTIASGLARSHSITEGDREVERPDQH